MKVVIIEDEYIVADHLSKILKKHGFETIAMADNLVDAVETLKQLPDLYLLDIRLANNHNGIDFGKTLQTKVIPFIYITANNELEVIKKAIATHPESYITKPFNERDVVAAIELVKLKNLTKNRIKIITPKGTISLLEKEILYCKADGSYTNIITANKTYIQRLSLKEISEKLSNNFVRVHHSYLVNKNKITSQKATSLYIEAIEIPISRSYKKKM